MNNFQNHLNHLIRKRIEVCEKLCIKKDQIKLKSKNIKEWYSTNESMYDEDPSDFELIKNQVYKAIALLGGDIDLLSIIGSWGDTLDDDEILDELIDYNKNYLKKITDSAKGEQEVIKP